MSGASGTIGRVLVPFLQTLGHDVLSLVRNKKEVSEKNIFWDPEKGILDIDTHAPFDAVINLNGADITRGRWTETQQKTIIDSRIRPTQLLASTLAKMKKKPAVFITSSAIGFYNILCHWFL
ncbi:MAG: NAD-dependent epimerase/dehydratase family protein [Thermodesulfobacteriota bacterium]|nr:NAD-dependent epimerase/dehydratase family protein [Thermodesulfobacteriota bacterium]